MNSKSKDNTPEKEAEDGEEQESFTPEAAKLPEPTHGEEEVAEEAEESPEADTSDVAEEAAENAESAEDGSEPEESEREEEQKEDSAEEFPEDNEATDPAEVAEAEAAAEKIAAGGRPLVEKAGQLRKEAQFVASQRMATGNINVGEIEIQLTFDVGEVTLTLKELEGMKEGYTLTTDRPVDEVVNIRANGHLIGRGRLVKVEGRLGVQIEELRGSSVSAAAQ